MGWVLATDPVPENQKSQFWQQSAMGVGLGYKKALQIILSILNQPQPSPKGWICLNAEMKSF